MTAVSLKSLSEFSRSVRPILSRRSPMGGAAVVVVVESLASEVLLQLPRLEPFPLVGAKLIINDLIFRVLIHMILASQNLA